MARLEDLQPSAAVRGILPDSSVSVVSVQWYGSEALELTYKEPSGRVGNELLYRHDEPRLEIVEHGRPWSFDGDGHLFRLVSEAHRIRLAHLFDPVLAVHTSLVEPLPHQITAVYEAMLPRQPLRMLLADDPGAGKTIMAGLLIKELIARGDLHRCLVVCPGSLAEQWQDELYRRFQLPFEILTNDKLEAARTGNWFLENNLIIARLDKLSRNEDVQEKLKVPDCRWDLIVCDEAHKMSATFFGGEVKYTKRYRLGQLLSTLTRHFLLMTATPHNGKEEDFQLFMALLDGDTKLAEDRAAQLQRDQDKVDEELENRIKANLRDLGDFARVHALPQTAADVPDDRDARLVVLGRDQAYSKEANCAAEIAGKAILETRGNSPRLFRNTLVFLAPDSTRLQDLDEALRRYLAWSSILADRETINLDPHQVRQAETQCEAANQTVAARLPETYQWLLVPHQDAPQGSVEWQSYRLSGQDVLAVRASKRLRNEELLISRFAGTRLKMELDKIPLWRGDHAELRQLVEDFAQYPYLPRLSGPEVLIEAVQDGVSLLTWEHDAFAFADSYNEAEGRYLGLRGGQQVAVGPDGDGLLVKSEVARQQMDLDTQSGTGTRDGEQTGEARDDAGDKTQTPDGEVEPVQSLPTRFYGTVELDSARVGRDAGRIADEVIAHLEGLIGADVRVTLEIEAQIPNGAPENVIRIVTENGRTLKFTTQGFESE